MPVDYRELVDPMLAGESPPVELTARLAAIGLTRFDVWSRLAARWIELAGPAFVGDELLPAALQLAADAPDPDLAALNLSKLQAELGSLVVAQQIAADPRFGHDLLFLLGLGAVPGEAILRDPGLIDLLLEPDLLAAEPDPRRLAADILGQVLRTQRDDLREIALRRWRRAQFVRIIARDFLLHRPQSVITREISTVADACVQAALAAAARDAGLPLQPDGGVAGVALIAMGKWGSRELNYNSDIDLIAVYRPTSGGPTATDWERIVRRAARDIDTVTPAGRVFRVDFRLRPEGASGVLVPSLESCVSYYTTRGEAWEAQALTRARFAAGDAELGARFAELAVQISYGTRVGRAGIATIRHNRERLDARADRERDVKEGHGGIRDIEFTTQLLQLVRGVTDPSVRLANTWAALEALTAAGALSELERRTLAEAYDFLRRVEHLLQIQPPAPTRELPDDLAAMRRLARALGYRATPAITAEQRFLDTYRSHTAAARDLCRRLFFNPIPLTSPDADAVMQDLLDPLQDDAEAAAHLDGVGFDDPAEARRRLLFLAHGEPPMRLPPETQALFVELLPTLLTCVQRMPDPDAALRWFERFVSRAGGREPFYRFLIDNPPVIELIARIGGFSEALSRTIVDHPEYLDHVVDPRFVSVQPTREDLADQLRARLGPLKRSALRLDDLRRFRRREQFRIGVQDLLGSLVTDEVTRQLSDLAGACLDALLAEVRSTVPGSEELPFAILGCGKLAGQELHYSSDLDVLFVYQPVDDRSAETAERLARALLQEANRTTVDGILYDLDARLRPYGSNSPLTRTLASYRAYWERRGAVWERLAMLRTAPVAGDHELAEELCRAAWEFALAGPPGGADLDEIRRIKRRIELERPGHDRRDFLDLKHEPGGLMDIEFIAQTLQILHLRAGDRPEAKTRAALVGLADRGHLAAGDADVLIRSYDMHRRIETRLQIVLERSSGLLPLDPAGLAAAAKRLGWSRREADARPQQLVADLRERLAAVRSIFERLVPRSSGPESTGDTPYGTVRRRHF